MRNVMDFEGGYQAVIAYDPEIEMFRGEFIGLNGGADFYANDAEGLKREGKISLDVFLRMCEQDGVSPKKNKGNFALRLDPDTYHAASIAASAKRKSLNQFIADAVRNEVNAGA
jgi:predicted HicB family RNase H-like nuclease